MYYNHYQFIIQIFIWNQIDLLILISLKFFLEVGMLQWENWKVMKIIQIFPEMSMQIFLSFLSVNYLLLISFSIELRDLLHQFSFLQNYVSKCF